MARIDWCAAAGCASACHRNDDVATGGRMDIHEVEAGSAEGISVLLEGALPSSDEHQHLEVLASEVEEVRRIGGSGLRHHPFDDDEARTDGPPAGHR